MFAYGEATVPKITITLRKSYGGAHDVMGCKQLRADINYAWPSAEIAVMGPKGAIEILEGRKIAEIEDVKQKVKYINEKELEYKVKFANPYDAAKYGYIDDIIEPRNTRFRIIRALQTLATKKDSMPPKKHSNIPL
jgi:acetyl-CoA carboxylase carboxyltransferase component